MLTNSYTGVEGTISEQVRETAPIDHSDYRGKGKIIPEPNKMFIPDGKEELFNKYRIDMISDFSFAVSDMVAVARYVTLRQ